METYKDFENLCIFVNESLLEELKKIKKENNFPSWNAMFSHILSVNKRPETLIKKYKRVYNDEKKKRRTFEPSLSPHVVIKFRTWAAAFSGQTDALDYLVSQERKRNKFHFLDDSEIT